jgi:hypothetical protein
MQDWLSNMNVVRMPMDLSGISDGNRPLVHWGFLRQFRSMQEEIDVKVAEYMERLERNKQSMNEVTVPVTPAPGLDINKVMDATKYTEPTLIVTGASLGGANASLAAVHYGMLYPDLHIKCITFGSPRVGNSVFVKYFANLVEHSERYVNQEDPVPNVPSMFWFEHVLGLKYIDRENQIHDTYTEDRFWYFMRDFFLSAVGQANNPINDHSCLVYLSKL